MYYIYLYLKIKLIITDIGIFKVRYLCNVVFVEFPISIMINIYCYAHPFFSFKSYQNSIFEKMKLIIKKPNKIIRKNRKNSKINHSDTDSIID